MQLIFQKLTFKGSLSFGICDHVDPLLMVLVYALTLGWHHKYFCTGSTAWVPRDCFCCDCTFTPSPCLPHTLFQQMYTNVFFLLLQVWKWTCKNDLFVLCSSTSLCVGIDDGKFSIYLDENLFHGRSQECRTFDNEPLTPGGDFRAAVVEVWTFDWPTKRRNFDWANKSWARTYLELERAEA